MNSAIRNRVRGGAFAIATLVGLLAPMGTAGAAQTGGPARAFVRLELPKHTAYVGESLPVTVRAFYRDDTGVTITGAPALTSPEFTLQAVDPAQSRQVIDGASYLVVTWRDHLSPVKSGRYTLGIDVPSTLEWRAPPAHRAASPTADPFGGDPFGDLSSFGSFGQGGDPFAQMQQRMQQFMNQALADVDLGPARHEDVTLHAPAATLDVRDVPLAGRPADFTGAVGHFTMTASADPTQTRAGEPIRLTLHVKGTGSFDRVSVPGVADSSDWRTYAPTSTDGLLAGAGEKTFTQPLVALHPGITAVPATSFSFFDPDAAKFVTVSAAPIPVDVSPGVGTATSSAGKAPLVASGPTLAPNAETAGHPVTTLAPVFTRPLFWAAQAIPFTAFGAALLFALRRQRLRADVNRPRRREARRAIGEHRAAMDRALAAGDGVAFFAAAKGVLQQALGVRWGVEPAAISLAEVEARLDAEEARKLRPIFEADAERFSGRAPTETDLLAWRNTLDHELAHVSSVEANTP